MQAAYIHFLAILYFSTAIHSVQQQELPKLSLIKSGQCEGTACASKPNNCHSMQLLCTKYYSFCSFLTSDGCCPAGDYSCCPDGLHCAANFEECPGCDALSDSGWCQNSNNPETQSDCCSSTQQCCGEQCVAAGLDCCDDGTTCPLGQTCCNDAGNVQHCYTDNDILDCSTCPQGDTGPGVADGCCLLARPTCCGGDTCINPATEFCCGDGGHCPNGQSCCENGLGECYTGNNIGSCTDRDCPTCQTGAL